MTVAVPTDLDHLTPQWLASAMHEGGLAGAEISNVAAQRIGEGVGFIGELYRLDLTYSSAPDGAPSSVIAKLPTNEPGGRMLGSALRLYEKESGFYRHLVDDCPVPTPRCFYNGAELESGNWCLLLEDLDLHTPGDQLRPRNRDEMLTELSLLASIHARWADGRAETHGWLPTIGDESVTGLVAFFDEAYPICMERYGHLIPLHMNDWGLRFAPVAVDWITNFAAQPGTIIHGDFRTDNFMFDGAGTATVLDWQLTCRAPGAYDLYYYLGLSGDPDVVSEHFDGLIDHYLDEYAAAGGSPLDRDTTITQMKGSALWLTVLGTISASQLDPVNARGEELFLTMWKRGIRLAEQLDLSSLLP